MGIFVSSDPHFLHKQEFLWGPRGFADQYEMSETIVERWNELVAPSDEVYLLGDITLNETEKGVEYLRRLNGRIRIAIGNHDNDERIALYRESPNVVDVQYAYRIKLGKWRFYATHYPCLCSNWDDGKTPGQSIINLCGHTHTTNPFNDWDKGRIIHTEMDTNDCRPWSIEEIQDMIAKRA